MTPWRPCPGPGTPPSGWSDPPLPPARRGSPWEYAPETEEGRNLLAHELTHVVQQGGGEARVQRRIDPAPAPAHAAGSPGARAEADLAVLDLPTIKQRHVPLYSSYAGSGNLKRIRGYTRGRPAQVGVWRANLAVSEAALGERLTERQIPVPAISNAVVRFRAGDRVVSGPKSQVLERLKIPDWDRQGRRPRNGFQVDHIVELQVSGEHGTGVGNSIQNMELLDQPSNSSSGASIMGGIYGKVTAYLATLSAPPARGTWLQDHDLVFESVRVVAGRGGPEGASAWWTRAEIEQAEPVRAATPAPATQLRGEPNLFVLASGPGGVEVGRYRHEPAQLALAPGSPVEARRLAGLVIRQIQLTEAAGGENAGAAAGTLAAAWDLPAQFQNPSELSVPLVSVGPCAAHPGPMPALTTDFRPLSPLVFDAVEVREGRLYAEGRLTPSIPLLGNAPVVVTLDGDDLAFRVDYSPENLNLNFPGVQLDDALLSAGYSTRSGFGVLGALFLSAGTLGQGSLTASVNQAGGFECAGPFDFDTRLFDRARAEVWYRNRQFGGRGQLGIDRPDKIRGIRSASLDVTFGEGTFGVQGTVQPDLPGVQQAGLTVGHSAAEGLAIGGSLQLTANPAIRSGAIDVTVRKRGDGWRVAATGQAQPAIPGIDSQLAVSYDDGAFTAEFSGAYHRGRLAGTATVGTTNRALDPQGRPTGEAAPGAPLVVYGSGSATLQLSPWLQGTAGLRLDPSGEVTISGEIGLPSQVELFPRRQVDRSLVNVAMQFPIIPGIVAEIGGGLSAQAGFGPGVIDRLRLGVTYNPSREEDTRVTGDAHLSVPADAGLRLAVRAGVGVGITGASVTGGLEIGGALGVAGAAEAGVQIDWSPAAGLELNAFGAFHAEPRFRFDVSGYVSARALGISLYDNRWELAAYELGSNLRFGVRFPVRYREGQPFEISTSDVEFQVPEVNPRQLLTQLLDRIV
ncbi:MAG: eCIS core domain-containing protein [Deferrisomatales bacterium]